MDMNIVIFNRVCKAIGSGAITLGFAMLSGIHGLEGRRYVAYHDIAGILTVCDGHTGADIIAGKRYSDKECDALTQADIAHVANQIDRYIKVPATETERAALYSFAYNVGVSATVHSTMLNKLNKKDYIGACYEMKRWVYVDGRRWNGLVKRRDIESTVCLWGLHKS